MIALRHVLNVKSNREMPALALKSIKYKEAVMKKLSTAVILGLWLLISLGCSSTPPGTISVADLQKTAAERIGQEVVVVGMADTRTPLSSFRMFRLYNGNQYIWVARPESTEEPPQGIKVRVFGTLQEKEFTVIGKAFYIQATKVAME
jgi:hypothetical protein